MAGGIDYSPEKLQELILYVSSRSLSDPRFGKTKLNKILFFSDFQAYRQIGQSITGAVYHHLPQGPCPHQLLPALNALAGQIAEVPEPTYAGTQKRLVPLRPPDLSAFSGTEVAIIEGVLTDLRPLTNQQVSELSHETVAWRLTEDQDEIPYGTAVLSSDEPTDDDLRWMEGAVSSEALGTATG